MGGIGSDVDFLTACRAQYTKVQTFYRDELDRSTEQLQLLLAKIEAAAPAVPPKARDRRMARERRTATCDVRIRPETVATGQAPAAAAAAAAATGAAAAAGKVPSSPRSDSPRKKLGKEGKKDSGRERDSVMRVRGRVSLGMRVRGRVRLSSLVRGTLTNLALAPR